MAERLFAAAHRPHAKEAARQQQQQEHDGARVERCAHSVNEDPVEEGGQFGQVRNHDEGHGRNQDGRQHQHAQSLPDGDLTLFELVIDDENHRGQGEQVEQMHTHRKAHQERNQHQPAAGIRPVGLFLPFEDGPENHRGKEARHGVDLALHRGEPEGIGETVGHRSHHAGSQKGDGVRLGHLLAAQRENPAAEVDDGQVEEEDGQGRTECAHRIDGGSGVFGRSEHREKAADEIEGGISRRVAHFQLVRRCDKLSAIPEAGSRFDGQQIDQRGEGQHHEGYQIIEAAELLFVHV